MPCIQGASPIPMRHLGGRTGAAGSGRERSVTGRAWAAPFSGRLDSMYVAAPPSSSQWIGNGLVGRYPGCPLITAGGVARQAEGKSYTGLEILAISDRRRFFLLRASLTCGTQV